MATTGIQLNSLRVDGGASANNLLMQLQADQLQVPIERPSNLDSTALGAAYLAGLGIGYWKDLETLRGLNPVETSFSPENTSPEPYKRWKQAVQATIAFAEN
jgi:glycerol kinase